MKIEKQTFINFLNKCKMAGNNQIKEITLNFKEDGLNVTEASGTSECHVRGLLKKQNFNEYEELGILGISDLETFIKILKRFGTDLELLNEGNLLTIKGDKKSVDLELVAENFLKTDASELKLDYTENSDSFITEAKRIKDIFEDVLLNKDALLNIKTEEKKVVFVNTGQYKFHNIIDAPTCKGGVNVNFGSALLDGISNLNGTLEVSIKTDYLAKIIERTDNSIITIIVAPQVED